MTTVAAGAAVVLLLLTVTLLVLRRRLVVVSVTGESMLPTLRSGDRIVVRRVPVQRVRRGDVVVLREPWPGREHRTLPWMVKRVAAVPGDLAPAFLPSWASGAELVAPGTLVVLGDNPATSRDSRHFGAVPAGRLLGVAVRRLGGDPLPVG